VPRESVELAQRGWIQFLGRKRCRMEAGRRSRSSFREHGLSTVTANLRLSDPEQKTFWTMFAASYSALRSGNCGAGRGWATGTWDTGAFQ
jgi:hypothetical protein